MADTATVYLLDVRFKSNERPWSTKYDPRPYPPKSDEDAIRWAEGMAEGMGEMYDVQLLKDGVPFNGDKQ